MRKELEERIRSELFAMQDTSYKDFHAGLIPTIPKERIIGVRTPALRAYAKQFAKAPEAEEFLTALPHYYYEENNLHAFLIEGTKDYDLCIARLEAFLPYVDNWATCDMMSPKVLKKDLSSLLIKIREWISSDKEFMVRFGIELLMSFYLEEEFKPEYLDLVASVHKEDFYVRMMIAWYFATALAKQYDATVPYLEKQILSPWVHNKTIQKAVESNRISKETKDYLRTLKKKERD